MIAGRLLAVVLTIGLFLVVILGMGALFALFDKAGWGYLVGALSCVIMVAAAVSANRRARQ
ncbi:MAG: hypothetical protein IRZ08_07940 [Frankia sp.]|nr:hypothetical protein [Frankia sp.]